MGEVFVRTMNLAKFHFDIPLKSLSDPKRRALINELGFLLFKTSLMNNYSPEMALQLQEPREAVIHHAVSIVQRYQGLSDDDFKPPADDEVKESIALAKRLADFFRKMSPVSNTVLSPAFSGCGFIDNCVGDVLAGNTLYEVKSGDRPFRLIDVRQIVIYLALNSMDRKRHIESVGFVNPRLGTYYATTASELVLGISGKDLVDLMSEINDFVSSGGVSR